MRPSLQATILVAALALLAAPCPAKERASVDGLLEHARVMTEKGYVQEAAAALGIAARLAHKHGDLAEEAQVGAALGTFIRDHGDRTQTLLGTLIEALDATRAGAYVSAHALAREVLLRSSLTGERTGVPAAAEALLEFSRGKQRGKAAVPLASFARGLALLGEGPVDSASREQAGVLLQEALAACVEENWFETAVAIGTELAVLRLADGDAKGATEALALVARSGEDAGGYPDRDLLIQWSKTVRARLPNASDEVLAPHLEALKPLHDWRAEPAGAGGAGGADPCILGKQWKRIGKRKTLVSVERSDRTSVVRLTYVRKHEVERVFRTGHRYLVADGIVLGFHGHAVSLDGLDLRVVPGAPGGGPRRADFKAWYLLANGETWSLKKDGRVTVRNR